MEAASTCYRREVNFGVARKAFGDSEKLIPQKLIWLFDILIYSIQLTQFFVGS